MSASIVRRFFFVTLTAVVYAVSVHEKRLPGRQFRGILQLLHLHLYV
jgi:hypothetical protein